MKFLKFLCLLHVFSSSLFANTYSPGGAHSSTPSLMDPSEPSKVTEADYDASLSKIREIYGPTFIRRGISFRILSFWNSDSTGASAIYAESGQEKIFGIIGPDGGSARLPHMTKDSFMFILCHELIHFFGGGPYFKVGTPFTSVEGQADYFAAHSCMKKVLKGEDHEQFISRSQMDVPRQVYSDCENRFKDTGEAGVCIRTTMAGLHLIKGLAHARARVKSLSPETVPSLLTRDDSVVSKTVSDHPSAQCRVDTVRAGALGLPRPKCWYRITPPKTSRNGP